MREEFKKLHGRYPNTTWIGTDFFGPQNDIYGYEPSYPPEKIAKQHDIDVSAALANKDPKGRGHGLAIADKAMIDAMEHWWAKQADRDVKDIAFYTAYTLGIKSGINNYVYYPFI